jgi:imidazole glycerol-phosphate synthase subunit HisH
LELTNFVTVVDYGVGNIFSVIKAIEYCGGKAHLTNKSDDILNASRLILPGVGAFSKGMKSLSELRLIEPLKAYGSSRKPLLGICLGMQMLFTSSSEFGLHDGLNIIPGKIMPIVPKNFDGTQLKVPHIGWSPLCKNDQGGSWEGTILRKVQPESNMYFVHSFSAISDDDKYCLAYTNYGNFKIAAVVAIGNVFGCQFHPEKSGQAGLDIIRSFLDS